MPAQVRHDQPVAVGEQRHDAVPAVPVLRPAVQQHQRFAGAGLGDVHGQLAHLDGAVGDAGDDRHRDGHGRTPRPTGPGSRVGSTSYADAAHAHSSGRVSAGSTTSSTR